MVSSLSPLTGLRGQEIDPVGAYYDGANQSNRNALQGQQITENNQEIDKAEYDKEVQQMSVLNRLLTHARSLPAEQRPAFASSLNQGMLQSIGIDPKMLTQGPFDDATIDDLIAQTRSVVDLHKQTANFRKESVNTDKGLKVFDPNTGKYEDAKDSSGNPLIGAAYDPNVQGRVSAAKQDAQNQSDLGFKPRIAEATDTAKARVELATKPSIEGATTAASEKAKIDAINKQSEAVASGKLDDATALYNDLSKADLDKVYGRGESKFPDWARSQEGLDMIAKRNQLIAMLKLGARGELKGQGAVSDSESAMVADAATLLNNQDISPTLAKEALDRAMNVLRRNAGKNPDGSAIKSSQGGSGQNSSAPGITPTKGAKLIYDPATGTFK